MKECIRVVDLSKSYHRIEVVKSINFTVFQSKVCAFLGPNGAGKSTTMNMIATLLKKTEGKIYIDEMDLDLQKNDIKRSIGVVFQEDVLDGDLTIFENLYYRGGLYIHNNKELNHRIQDIAKLLSMEELLEKKYRKCSGGQRRLVQIGRALIANPTLLILDEPTIGLDPLARETVWKTLQKLNEQLHITIFFTTHYMEETAYADHVCMINQGDILLCSSLKELKKNHLHKQQSIRYPKLTIQDIYMNLLRGDSIWER